jgi:DNA-binding winged helix-turn-helix (wHTH) protein
MRYDGGEIVVDGDARQLRLHGQAVHLSAKAFDLLRLLVEKRPRALSKQEIYDQLWPDTFVGEASLPVLIREIRTALGRESRDVIRTVHRFGYAFDAPMRERPIDSRTASCRSHLLQHDLREFALTDRENIIGRDRAAQVCLPFPSVSRHHAAITIEDDNAMLKDLGSKNGTRLNGTLIDGEMPLEDGAIVMFGAVELVYHCYDPNLLTESLHH